VRVTGSRIGLALGWILTRALSVWLLLTYEGTVTGDPRYFNSSLSGLLNGSGLRHALQEYPLPALAILLPQRLIAAGNENAFIVLFCASMLAVDALFSYVLWRAGNRRPSAALVFWLCLLPTLGPLVFCRFDIVPAVLAGSALIAIASTPGRSGALTAAGAAVKLWPVLLLPSLLLRRRPRGALVQAFVALGALALGVSVAIGGVGRTISPLQWQGARGLQVESVAATPVILAQHLTDGRHWTVTFSTYFSEEISGPGVALALGITTGAMAAGALVLSWLWLRARRLAEVPIELIGWLVMATVMIFVVTDKTLSPQYLLWLAALTAAQLSLRPSPAAKRVAGLLLVASLLTQFVYPLTYLQLLDNDNLVGAASAGALTVRNLILCWLAGTACR
jgi:hypothetical protein